MRALSLCSGIGGLDLAAEWAGIEIAGQVELDPYCRAVLRKHWSSVPHLTDLREVRGDECGSIDLVFGGIPCQPFSVAGKRRGTADDRHLWPQMLRIIENAQPAWVVVENVAGFVGVVLDDVCADLDSRGYEARAFVFPAAAVGAPHRRERCFVVAHRDSRQRERLALTLRSGRDAARLSRSGTSVGLANAGHGQRQGAERLSQGRDTVSQPHAGRATRGRSAAVADAAARGPRCRTASWQGGQPAQSSQGTGDGQAVTSGAGLPQRHQRGAARRARSAAPRTARRETESGMGREPYGLPGGLDRPRWPAGPGEAQHEWEAPRTVTGTVPNRAARLKALGNAVVPQQAYPIFAAIIAAESERSA